MEKAMAHLAAEACRDQISIWVDHEINTFHRVIRARHWANPIGRDILKHLISSCSEEIWVADPMPAFEPPLNARDAKWIAAFMIAEGAKEAKANLKPYARNYGKTAPWYFKPWAMLESAVCSRAILPVLDDLIQIHDELRVAHANVEVTGRQSAA